MLFKCKKALVLAPHTDDGELGCGATISKLIKQKIEVFYVAFSSCEGSLPCDYKSDSLIIELHRATSILNIEKNNVKVLPYKVRLFERSRQEILDDMIKLNNELDPDLVFMPSLQDIHQDHQTIAAEGLRAFKKKTILAYELPWNNFSFNNQVFSCVDEEDVNKKIEAISCYESQKNRNYVNEQYIKSLLITHGVQIGVQFAEVFETPRLIF